MLRINTTRQELLLSLPPKFSYIGCVLVNQTCLIQIILQSSHILETPKNKNVCKMATLTAVSNRNPISRQAAAVLQEAQIMLQAIPWKSSIKDHYINHCFLKISAALTSSVKRSHTWLYQVGGYNPLFNRNSLHVVLDPSVCHSVRL